MMSVCAWSSVGHPLDESAVGMFTGIIESVGSIRRLEQSAAGLQLSVAPGAVEPASLNIGDSVAVSGVCLTVAGIREQMVDFHVSNETVSRTRFAQCSLGQRVNIERSLTLAVPLGGHLVSGHVDGMARCSAKTPDGASCRLEFEVAGDALGQFMVEKGSVAIDGVSMTINSVVDRADLTCFTVNVIPHTSVATTLGELEVGQQVHIEIDMLARYAYRMMEYAGLVHRDRGM